MEFSRGGGRSKTDEKLSKVRRLGWELGGDGGWTWIRAGPVCLLPGE